MKLMKWCLMLVGLLAMSFSVAAQDLGAIQNRMAQRLGEVNELKVRKVVGENNQGYLEFVGAARDSAAVVEAENADRKVVYAAVAAKAGGSPEQAGRARAKQLREQSAAGIMIQDETGRWVEKR